MLNDVTNAQLHVGPTHLERSLDNRERRNVKTVQPAGSPPLQDRAKTPAKNVERVRRNSSPDPGAVDFRREETSLHKLYRTTRETVETSRAAKIEELRQAFKNETYRPNLLVVADRLLSSGELGRI